MANRYWVGGTGTWNTTSTTNWSANSGGSGGASVPTTADSVFFDQAGTYTVTMTGALNCLDITVSAGTVTFATGTTPTLIVAGSMLLSIGTVWNSTGTITFSSTATRTITTNGVTLNCSVTNTNTGTLSLGSALTLGTTNTLTLTQGTLNLNGFDLTTGAFNSNTSNTRAITFGTNNITLAHTTAGTTNLAMATTTGFTFTGTGGFRAAANITRTFQFGSTTAGGFEPNLTFTGTGSAVQTITTNSWFKTLDFGTTTFNPGNTVVNLNNLILSTGPTYNGLSVNMFRTGTITSNGKAIAALTINVTLGTATCTLAGPLTCTTYTQTAGTFDFAGFNLTCSGAATYTAGILLNVGTISCTTWTVDGTFTHNNGTITPSTSFVINSGAFNYTTGTLGAVPTFTHTAGTASFSKAYALTATGTYTLNAGSLILDGVDLTTGTFTSSSTSTRSISFGSNNIVLATTTAAQTVLSMGTATNFTWSGTGGFTTAMTTTRTFTFGTSGGSAINAPNLSITSGASIPTFSDGSWFNVLNFTGTTCAPTINTVSLGVRVDTLTLATGGTYTGFVPVFTRTQTWTAQFGKQLGGIGVNGAGVTLTLDNTQTYTTTSIAIITQGTLDLGGVDLTIGAVLSSNTNTRAINFGVNNIILSTTTAAQTNLQMAIATNFTYTGTGGFIAAANITRAFQFGSTSGGSASNAPNLAFTGSGTAVQTLTTGSWFNKLDFGTTAFNPGSTLLNLNAITLSSGGTFGSLSPTMVGTGNITSNGNTSLSSLTINTTGTTTLGDALTLVNTTTIVFTAGTLDLGGFTLTTGAFSSSNSNTRAINFGSTNIVLATPSSGQTVLAMNIAANFSYTGTGGFTASAIVTRTFAFGSSSGATAANAPNLTFTGSAPSIQTITSGSWFNTLNFGTTTFTPSTTVVTISTLTLSSGGTYTGLFPIFTRTQTWTAQFGKQLGGIGVNGAGVTLTLDNTQTYTATSGCALTQGTLDLGGADLTIGSFASNNSNTRAINFGVNNIILSTTTAAVVNLEMTTATNFTYTGTGGFRAAADITRTFTFGTTGGSGTNAPNLAFTGSGTAVQTLTTGSWFNKLDFGTTAFNPGTTALNLRSLTLSSGGTFTSLTPTMIDTGTITTSGKNFPNLTINHSGTTTLADALTLSANGITTLTAGTLDLANYTLTTGTFVSSNSNIRAINFGSANIVLATSTAGQNAISMATATNFTWTGTGGFTTSMSVTRSFRFGDIAGGSATNAPNLSITSGTSTVSMLPECWFKTLDFTGSTCAVSLISTGYGPIIDTLILATGGTYTSIIPVFTRTQTWTAQFGKQLGGIGVYGAGVTLTLDNTQTYTATSGCYLIQGTLDLGGTDLTIGTFVSSNSNTRAINFGVNNIILSTTTTAQANLSMAIATNFSYTGTGGFRATADITRTFTFGTTNGSSVNAPNLTFTGTGTAVQTLSNNSWFNLLDFGTTGFNPGSTTLNVNSIILPATGIFTAVTIIMRGTGTLTSNGETIGGLEINTTGTATLADALTVASSGLTTLTQGTLNLAGFTLTAGRFISTTSNTRSINFGSANIVLSTNTAGQTNLTMQTATNFTWTGTGGFVANASITRTFRFGETTGASNTNAPNLSFTGLGSAVQTLNTGSWFNTLDFGNTTFDPGISTLNLNNVIFSASATYNDFSINMKGTGSISGSNETIANLTIDHTGTTTLEVILTVTGNTTLTKGTLTLATSTLSVSNFVSSNSNTRAINFGSGNILIEGNGGNNLQMANATNFTWTSIGTNGFRANMSTSRSFAFGNTAGGSAANAPNLTVFTGGSTTTFFNKSWFKNLIFTGSTSSANLSGTTDVPGVNVDTLTLASGGTYTSFIPVFIRTQTWNRQQSKQLGGIGVNGSDVTLTLDALQTYSTTATCVLQAGVLNLASNNLAVKDLKSTADSGTSRSITGGGTITLSGDWTVTNGIGFAGTDYSVILAASVAKTFAGGGGTYGTLVQKSNTPLTITGSNSFADLQISNDMVQY